MASRRGPRGHCQARPRRRSRPARASSERRACHARRERPGSGDGFASNPEGSHTSDLLWSLVIMWAPRPTAQGRRGLDRPLFNLSQRRPGTKLSVPSGRPLPAGRRSPSRVGGGAHRAACGATTPCAACTTWCSRGSGGVGRGVACRRPARPAERGDRGALPRRPGIRQLRRPRRRRATGLASRAGAPIRRSSAYAPRRAPPPSAALPALPALFGSGRRP